MWSDEAGASWLILDYVESRTLTTRKRVPMTASEEPHAADLQSSPEDAGKSTGRARGTVTALLVIVTSLSVVLAAIGFWAHNTVLDTDSFMEAVQPALQEPALYTALGDRISAEALEALDLETRIASSLGQLDDFLFGALVDALEIGERGQAILNGFDRPSLDDLAPAVTSGLEERITARIDNFVASPEFQTRLPELVRAAHAGTIALLRGDLDQIPNVSVENGEVTLNLIPVIGESIRRVLPDLSGLGPDITLPESFSDRVEEAKAQLETAIGAQLPDDFGQITVMSEDRLDELQDGVVLLDRMMWALIALSLILLVVTMVISRTRRRTAIQLTVGILIGLLISEALLRWVEGRITDTLVSPTGDEAATAIMTDVFSGLRDLTLLLALAAAVLGFVAYLSGRPAWAMRVKAWWDRLTAPGPGGSIADRWVSGHYDLVRAGGIVVAVLALFLIEINLLTLLIVAAVLALFLWAVTEMRKRTEATADEPVSV